MTRDVDALTSRRWDLLVVGGGIHGLFAAYDAAQRGLSVALVEAGDFGSGLSFNHQRTLHGGLRALQGLRLGKVREQLTERRMWARIAPHLIRPLPFLIGTYRSPTRSRLAMRAGFAVYEFAGRRRNAGVPTELHLPKTRLESLATTRRLFPRIGGKGLSGGAIWYDYQTVHPDRLTWLVARAAERAGAHVTNYVRAVAPLPGGAGSVKGAHVQDVLSGGEYDVDASVTLLAAGSGIGELARAFALEPPPPLLRAMNLLLDRPSREIALAAAGRSGRMLTAVPWRGGMLVGTHQSERPVDATDTVPPAAEIDAFLEDIRSAFPSLDADVGAIRLVHHGLTPGAMAGGRADLLPEPAVIRHSRTGRPGVISLIGVKYTTARLAAERAVDAVCRELGRGKGRCRTDRTTLPYAGLSDVEGRLVETQRELRVDLDGDVMAHLAGWYGTEAADVLRVAAAQHALGRLVPAVPIIEGEIRYAMKELACVRLSDVVLRRTPLGSAGHPGRPALDRAAAIMAQPLGWSEDRVSEEIASVEARYPVTAP